MYAEMETISKKIFGHFDGLQMLSSPEEWLELSIRETMVACRQVLMEQASVVSYGKTVEGGSKSQQEQTDNAKGRVAFNYEHERNHVPVLCKKSRNTVMDYPSVSKLPALNTDALRGASKCIEDFISRFPGVSADWYGQYFNFAHGAMFYPGPVMLESSIACVDFKKLARNIFINTKTKTILVFLGGVEPYRQVDMLFSAAAVAFPGLAKRVGMAECIAFYPDLMCAEYDFISFGLKELLQDSCYGIMDIKINCVKGLDRDGNDDEENIFPYREDFIKRMPFVVVEICNLAQRLINNGLAITKAMANYFAMDIKDNTRPVLAILDCLSPLGYDFKTAERQVKKTQRDAPAQNRVWSEEIEEEKTGEEVTCSEEAAAAAAIEESIDNYYPFLQDRNETFYRVPAYIIPSCAPEITNVPIFSGGSSIDIVSEATEASTAYVIGKEETLHFVKITKLECGDVREDYKVGVWRCKGSHRRPVCQSVVFGTQRATRNRSPKLGHYHVEYNYDFIRLYLKPEATGALKP
ncbi:hypothetical protein O3P69_007198 [Scylla paramamosain]|uniref:Uncharacterized protein n=1 Tax=Scylla paramamosain TaxID=85552 RepID=A0AAW0V1V3_SCYPA